MYAIIGIRGQQFRVTKNDVILTQKIDAEIGSKVEFDNVVLLSSGKTVTVGSPVVEGAKVEATVIEQTRAKKVVVFKKKRRKGYKVKNGHRQSLTKLRIDKISN